MASYTHELWGILCEAAPWLLVGFALAGALHVLLPDAVVQRGLGAPNLASTLRAALAGLPLPLCSCSVIPTAGALQRAGASKGATAAFLVSTPETGVDSVGITWALFDPLMTIARPVTSFVTAVAAGTAVNALEPSEPEGASAPEDAQAPSCCKSAPAPEDCCDEPAPGGGRVRAALRFAFRDLLDDLAPWLVIGLLLSALVAVLVPEGTLSEQIPMGWASMLFALLLGTPLYVCATASTPVAAALVAKGLDPGAALVFLLVGPATNLTTVLVVKRLLGARALGAYLGAIVGVALVAGCLTNALYGWLEIDLSAAVSARLHAHPGMLAEVAAMVLVLLLGASLERLVRGRFASAAD